MMVYIVNSKRVAKNTLVLYGRTFIILIVSLYTARITLHALGVRNYGIESAVGGVISMFSIVSGSLSNSISRFITFELGHGDSEKLKRIFATAMNIQIVISLILLLLGETIGVWFLNTQMNIPADRMEAANWVLQCAMFSFIVGLTGTPYNACIIGHERMDVFAYFGMADVFLKLLIVYLLYISPFDKLVTFSVLGLLVSILIRIAYNIFCRKVFSECKYQLVYDKALIKEMTGFAGWSFLTNTAWILNTSGINILINIFFGVEMNAARGIAVRIEAYIHKFTSDFMTALDPQITKSYAAGEREAMFNLVCKGAKFAYLLMFCLSLPFMYEAYTVLYIWFGVVPEHTVSFFRLSMIASMITILGNTGYTACMATGKIKWYTIIMTSVGFLVFPFTWLAFHFGYPAESAYIVFIILYIILDVIRLYLMKHLLGFPIMLFIHETLLPVMMTSIIAVVLPTLLSILLEKSVWEAITVMCISFISAIFSSYMFALKKKERSIIIHKTKTIIRNRFLNK